MIKAASRAMDMRCKREIYQPWLDARRMEKVLARQLLHLVIHNQVFPANSTLSLTTQSSNDFFGNSYNRKISHEFL